MLEEVERFERWREARDVMPTIRELRSRGEAVVAQVLDENEGRWESLTAADRERLDAMARAISARLLHEPTLRLKASAAGDGRDRDVRALRELFGLEPGG